MRTENHRAFTQNSVQKVFSTGALRLRRGLDILKFDKTTDL